LTILVRRTFSNFTEEENVHEDLEDRYKLRS